MREIIMDSYGKVNLALDILYKRDDGYHEIKSIMQRISLRDRLIFQEIDHGIVIESNHPEVPKDKTNLVYRAWEKLVSVSGENSGIKVIIEKNIPLYDSINLIFVSIISISGDKLSNEARKKQLCTYKNSH